jgi:DUF1680 family protein
VEEADAGAAPHRLVLAPDATIEASFEPELLGGVVGLRAGMAVEEAGPAAALYSTEPPARQPRTIRAIPYFAWDNREAGGMRVWLRQS